MLMKRQQVAEIDRPLIPKAMSQASGPVSDIELEDEQRDGDGKYRVAERLDPARSESLERWSVEVHHPSVIPARGRVSQAGVLRRRVSMVNG
jgi:hypothetical protein